MQQLSLIMEVNMEREWALASVGEEAMLMQQRMPLVPDVMNLHPQQQQRNTLHPAIYRTAPTTRRNSMITHGSNRTRVAPLAPADPPVRAPSVATSRSHASISTPPPRRGCPVPSLAWDFCTKRARACPVI